MKAVKEEPTPTTGTLAPKIALERQIADEEDTESDVPTENKEGVEVPTVLEEWKVAQAIVIEDDEADEEKILDLSQVVWKTRESISPFFLTRPSTSF